MKHFWRLGCVAFLATGACGPDAITPVPQTTPSTPDAGSCSSRVCAPGSTELCYCVDISRGVQSCAMDGMSWEPCVCVHGDASKD